MEDDLPPLVSESGEELSHDNLSGSSSPSVTRPKDQAKRQTTVPAAGALSQTAISERPDAMGMIDEDDEEQELKGAVAHASNCSIQQPLGVSEEEGLRAAAALRAAAQQQAAGQDGDVGAETISAASALKDAMVLAAEPQDSEKSLDEKTKRLIMAISKDDFEECEDAILQGANVNADAGAGMCPLHLTALRGESSLTELLLAHGANVNQRDLSGNTPLLYACHFYRQHQRGVQLVSQLLYHRADPLDRVKDGKLAGKSAQDLMEKSCYEPNADESVPRRMLALLQLAAHGSEGSFEAIAKTWMEVKSQNKKLFQVSSKKDNYNYLVKNIEWAMPEGTKTSEVYAPIKLQEGPSTIIEEKFTEVKDYLFADEGSSVKVYVTFPASAAVGLNDPKALQVDFEFQAFDLKLRLTTEKYRLRVDPLFGSIEVDRCKHRVSASSSKVTLTLLKRHPNRPWPALQKSR